MEIVAKRKAKGQAIIEFTLLIPLIIIIVGGLSDLGLALYVGINVENAVREGARIAATIPLLGANNGTVQTAVKDRVPDISQFPKSSLNVTNTPPGNPVSCGNPPQDQLTVTVTAAGPYSFVFLRYIGFDTVTIARSATMRYEPGQPLCT